MSLSPRFSILTSLFHSLAILIFLGLHSLHLLEIESLMLMRIEIFPFFNFANHNYHGVDVKKYYDALKAEDEATVARET